MSNTASKRLTRPASAGMNPELQAIYENLEILNGARGQGFDRAILMRDLVDLGIISAKKGASGTLVPAKPDSGGGTSLPGEVIESPTIPLNVMATGGFSSILIEWDKPTYKGHSYTEVLRASADNFSEAVKLATTAANLYSDSVGADKTFYYWVRFVNKSETKGPIQSTNGIRGATEQDIGDILDKLKGNIDESFLTPEFNSRMDDYGDNITRNDSGIITLEGELVDIKSTSEILSIEAEILAEGIAEVAAGVDKEGYTRRFINARVLKAQQVFITEAGAMAQQIEEISVNVGDNKASIIEAKTAIVTLDQQTGEAISAVTEVINTQQSQIGTINAKVQDNTITIARVDTKTDANGQEISRVNVAITERLNLMSSTIGSNSASITQNSQTIVEVESKANGNTGRINVMSQQLTTVTSQIGAVSATVTQNSQTIATINDNGTSKYLAQWGVKASIGDIQAGIGLTVKRETGKPDVSQCTIIADQFSVGSIQNGVTIYPFMVANHPTTGVPGVFINTAYIKAASIQELVAGSVIADTIKASASITSPAIKGGSIEIGSRFTVDANGNMTANHGTMDNATVTGTIYANAGTFNNVTINENCTVLGTIYANKIVGDVYKAVLLSLQEKFFIVLGVPKNTYIDLFFFSITAENMDRKLEIPRFFVNPGDYNFYYRILFKGSVLITTKLIGNLTFDYFIDFPRYTSGTVIIQGMYNGDDPVQSGPFPPVAKYPEIPAQNTKYAIFKG